NDGGAVRLPLRLDRGELSDRHRLYRRADAPVADLLHRAVAGGGDALGHRQAAEAALARAHAGAGEGLELVRAHGAEADAVADLPRRHLLAAADDRAVVADGEDVARGRIELVEETAEGAVARHPGAKAVGAPVALAPGEAAEAVADVERGEGAGELGRDGAEDAGAVADDADRRQRA